MRFIIIYVIPLFIILLIPLACSNPTDEQPPIPADLCQIHLQRGFFNTSIIVKIDNNQVFADTITTTPNLGVASIIPVQISKGSHELNVNVAESISKNSTFTILDTLYIGINYDAASSQIAFVFQDKPFYYR